ncbi:Na(+)/H(+) exchanger protein 7-like [Dreissena polymorpha]|uniref:Sodium/hydrogen exchanger n=1 Tax=Dreissena polymorpha TaxID=45954 RepID=A0A9D4JKX2_DREPO|nr:Na(+)/H(+) exchanger protein 7-like [Dreissena polymorpha]KAH3812598.1 hypothetical protein DPMN_141034 [Dreissena polymorpha]
MDLLCWKEMRASTTWHLSCFLLIVFHLQASQQSAIDVATSLSNKSTTSNSAEPEVTNQIGTESSFETSTFSSSSSSSSQSHSSSSSSTPSSNNTNSATTVAKSKTEPLIQDDGPEVVDLHDKHGQHGDSVPLAPIHFSHVKYALVFSVVVIVAGLSKILFHHSHFLSSRVPESCVLIVVGIIFGLILRFSNASEKITLYEPHEFFLYLLPPIILESAFSLHDRTFADNIGGVLLFAVVGTVLNCFLIGPSLWGLYQVGAMEEIDCSFVQILVFSALIVAVDPVAVLAIFQEVGVNNTLYFLVFGESLLNDGVTVVLYNVMQVFNGFETISVGHMFLGVAKFFIVCSVATLIGIVCGLIASFLTKFTNSVKVVEPMIVFGFAYISYLLSEMFQFSGIVSIIACGIVLVHYAFHNVTKKSRMAIKFVSKVMANACEIIVFMFIGFVTVNQTHDWKSGFILWTTLLCIVYRFVVTYSLSYLVNRFASTRVRKISYDEMFMISYGGLRGAICFSLAALIDETAIPAKKLFVTATLFVIFFTVFVQGGTIKWLTKKFRISLADTSKEMRINEELSSHVFDHVCAGMEEIMGYTTGQHHLKAKIYHWDDTIIRPILLRNATYTELEDISTYYEKLVMKEHYKNLQLSGAKIPRVKSSIRRLDSTLALEELKHHASELGSTEALHDTVARREQEVQEENRRHGDEHHKFFPQTLRAASSRLHRAVHDKNITASNGNASRMINLLRKKHTKNSMLSEMRERSEQGDSFKPVAAAPSSLSLNSDGSTTYEENGKSSHVVFTIQDTLSEEDETKGDHAYTNATFHF